MESRPTIRIQARRTQPEYRERLRNWVIEAYNPLLITIPEIQGIDYYEIIKENPQYERTLSINHYANRFEMLKPRSNPIGADVIKDSATWMGRSEMIWWAAYELVKDFRQEEKSSNEMGLLETENAPTLHIEGFALSANNEGGFMTWFAKWGYEFYIPLLTRLPGLKGYFLYKFIDIGWEGLPEFYKPKRPVEYPLYLSFVHFDNIESYEHYEKSIELAGFRDAMNNALSGGLDFRWYVQYQLVKSWRK